MKTTLLRLLAAATLSLGLGAGTAEAAPAAGTVIGNQATATYNDAGGTARTATSNLVQVTVTQVKSFTLTADGARTAVPGQVVYYPHTITNTGNGTDTYSLNAPTTGGVFAHTGLVYYLDADGNGVPDTFTPIATSGPIAMGGVFRFVVAGTVPGGATNGQTGTITISVTDTNAPPATLSNTDTTTVSVSAVTVTKGVAPSSGPSPNAGPITITLTYTNTGSAAATNVELRDVIPAGMTYIAGSGRWSVSGATPLTDGTAIADPAGVTYDYNVSAANRVTAVIATVPAASTGTLRFDVSIDAGRAPGNIDNQAQYLSSSQLTSNTNVASYTVTRSAGVVANGSNTNATNGTLEPVTVASASPGASVDFNNFIWNTGNAADSFGIALTGTGTWPAGTTFTLLQTDAATPLIAGTTPAIPAYAAGCPAPFVTDATNLRCGYRVVLRVQLPTNATSAGALQVTKTATSVFDTTRSDTVIDQLGAIAANTVDLTNGTARTDSLPAGTAAAGNAATTGWGTTGTTLITTNTVTPGAAPVTTRFPLYVNQLGVVADNFNLSVTGTPAGWTVTFNADGGAGNCSTLGAAITATGPLNPGANRLVCAQVTVPALASGQAAPGTFNLDFRAQSALNATVFDVKRDAVTVNAVRLVTLVADSAQSTFPGGAVLYTHTLANAGNMNEPITFAAGFLTDSRAGWTSVAYRDNGNGTFDPGVDDVPANQVSLATAFTLNVGATQVFFVRVTSPVTALSVDPANLTRFTATYNATTVFVTDSTTVTGSLTVTKEQVAVTCAAPGPHAGYSAAAISPNPLTTPGSCIAYRVTVTNSAGIALTAVTATDAIPANTRQRNSCGAPAVAPAGPVVTSPGDGNAGTVSAAIGPLNPGQSSVLTFCVRIL